MVTWKYRPKQEKILSEIPHERLEVWSMDFVTDLPPCSGFNGIYTCVDKLTKFVKLIPVLIRERALSAPEVARLFFVHNVHLFGISSCGFTLLSCSYYSPLLALFVGIIGFLGCIIFGLPSTVGWADWTYSSERGLSTVSLSTVFWLSGGSLRIDGANSFIQLNWILIQLFTILQVFHPVDWFLVRSCIYPLILWWVQLAMSWLHRILPSSSVSWLILFVHLCKGHRNVRQYLIIIVDMRRSLLWVIGFCWMLTTLASLGSINIDSSLWVYLLLPLILVR